MLNKVSKAMVIYDAPSATVRRIIVAEDDAHYDLHHIQTVGRNESYTYLHFNGQFDYRSDLDQAKAAVVRATGRFPIEQ